MEWIGLGVAVAKVALRAYAQADGMHWTDVADGINDIEGGLAGLRSWVAGRRDLPADQRLGKAIAEHLSAELGRAAGDDRESAAAVEVATTVVEGMVNSGRRDIADQTLLTALASPEQLYDLLKARGAAQRRNVIAEGRPERFYDLTLRAACRELVRVAPTAQRTVPAALTSLLRRADEMSALLARIEESTQFINSATEQTRARVEQLVEHARHPRPAVAWPVIPRPAPGRATAFQDRAVLAELPRSGTVILAGASGHGKTQIAAVGAAVVEGLSLRRIIAPAAVEQSFRLTAFEGSAADQDWSVAALGFTSILSVMLEDDPDFDESRLPEIRTQLRAAAQEIAERRELALSAAPPADSDGLSVLGSSTIKQK